MIETDSPARAWTGETRFKAALAREEPDRTPVWFMRQAGRCLADYRKLRERYSILTLAKTPDLCAQITVMPVEAFGVDAAVLFADIMLPLEPMGVDLEIQPEVGPIIHSPGPLAGRRRRAPRHRSRRGGRVRHGGDPARAA